MTAGSVSKTDWLKLPGDSRPRLGPLAGLTVLDLTRLLPGPFCTLLLAQLGAEVVKVEDLDGGDGARWTEPRLGSSDETLTSARFIALNRGKRSVRLNLKSAGGRQAFIRLARDADALIESFRPGVMERLGLGWEDLRGQAPRLVYCSLTGYGRTGPLSELPGHDLGYVARSGLLALSGPADGEPTLDPAPVADIGGGALMAAVGILAALMERSRSDCGQLVDVSMLDGTLAWTVMHAATMFAGAELPQRGRADNTGGSISYAVYRCRDGWITVAAAEPKFWSVFCHAVGRPELVDHQYDSPGSPAHRAVQEIALSRSRAEWEAFNRLHPCCVDPVLELDEALESEVAARRGMVVEFQQEGIGRVRGLGVPIQFERTPGDPGLGAPSLGAHTAEILERAGYSPNEIADLIHAGCAAGPVSNTG